MTVGLDVSDQYTSLCFLEESGEIVEEGRVRTTVASLGRRFEVMAPCRVVLEVGTHSPWLSRLLDELGHQVIVANPGKVRLIADSMHKNDRSDAEILARLGRVDPQLLSPITHRSEQAQVDLAVIRARNAFVCARTLLINHARGAVKSYGARLARCDAHSFHKKVAGSIPERLVPALEPLLPLIAQLTQQIADSDAQILAMIRERYPEARVLQQVPGVGPLIALTFILTIGDPYRFKKSRQVGPYLGLVPGQRESGDRSPQLGISKAGSVYLRKLLVNGSQHILGPRGADTDLRRWGLLHAVGGKRAKKRAVVGVARRLAVLLHRLWLTGEVYIPLRSEEVAA
ncbi:MAG: IS110 family transposase [Candidatus Dormibacteraeota bacterium]|nr:IS110 family transposase [Candidatus Dormibacteraeota bacterium]